MHLNNVSVSSSHMRSLCLYVCGHKLNSKNINHGSWVKMSETEKNLTAHHAKINYIEMIVKTRSRYYHHTR